MDYLIGYDKSESDEMNPRYFVYESKGLRPIVYKGTYTQCLCIVGAIHLDPDVTIPEIRSKSNGFV
jgi:hypothetical protein